MNAERLLQHYEQIADAPDAIARLRRFILDLAVRGKLAPQNPNDEPVSELLKRIAKEKARLVKAGEIKKLKPLSLSHETEAEVPSNWALVPFCEVILQHLGGGTPSKSNESYWNGDLRWASVKDVGKSKYLDETIDRITESGLANSSSNLIEPGNLLVVTRMGLGKVSINRIPVAINQDLRALFLSENVSIDYAYNFFLTHGFEGTGLTVKGIKLEELLRIPFPLPPLAEQHRIVAKVDELMALCDRLEAARAAREATRDRLAAASLARLNAPDPDTFRGDARFALEALPALTKRPDQIKQLRQTILNLAVRGKLVPQDATDEPASELLKRIASEKSRLVKAGEIARDKPLPPLTEAEAILVLPPGWEWVRLGHLSQMVTSGSRDWAKYYANEGAIFVRMGNLSKDHYRLRLDHIQYVKPPADGEGTRTRLNAGDILISITGEVGMLGLIPEGFGEAYINQHTAMVRLIDEIKGRYLPELFRSPFAQAQFNEPQRGIKNSFRLTDITQFVVPLPPLAEQHRIVAKVDALMALCDRLEASLTATATTRQRLLEALLAEALAPVDAREMEAAE